jgi:hypothetical protein
LRRGDDDEFVVGDRLDGERGVGDFALDEAEVDLAGARHRRDVVGVADAQLERDAGIKCAKGDQPLRQPVAADGLARRQQKFSGLQPGEIGKRTFGGAGAREYGPRSRRCAGRFGRTA